MNGWIVLWTIKYIETGAVKPYYRDFTKIFIEYDESEYSPEEQARILFNGMINGDFDYDDQELYTANLCEIKESTEAHYTNIEE